MSERPAVRQRIEDAMALARAGDCAGARVAWLAIWEGLGDGDVADRLLVAHAAADVQDDPRAELAWDLEALRLADVLAAEPELVADLPVPVAGLYPSLHLNAGDAYRRAGDAEGARRQLRLGRAALERLGADPYGGMLAAALERLRDRLDHCR